MVRINCLLLILLLPILTYSIPVNFDVTLVKKIILYSAQNRQYYCINKKTEIADFIDSFSNNTRLPGVDEGDIRVIFKTENGDHDYWIFKNHNDSLMNYYSDLVNNKPNWFQFKIVSNRLDLIDTSLNYLRANYYVEPLDRIRLISHRIRIESKELIEIGDKNKFIELINSMNKSFYCTSHGPLKYGLKNYDARVRAIHIIDFYFKDIFTLTEAMRYLDSEKWVKITDVEIRNDFTIKFWVEMELLNKKNVNEIIKKLRESGMKFETFDVVDN